jgi:hypothetical protein
MANTKRTKKVQSLVTRSLEVDKISVIVGSKQTYQEICNKIVPSTATPESLSVSVFKYVGKTWEGGSILAGFCDTLGKGIILFTGENAQKLFEDFRILFLSEPNKDLYQNLTIESSLVVGLPLDSPHTKAEVTVLFEKLNQIQKTKNPKVSIDKNGNLYIGGKTTSNFICISGNFEKKADDLSTTRVLRVDLRFKGALDFFMLLANNKEVEVSVLIVYEMLKRISKVKFVGVLSDMQKIFVSLNQFGKIAEPVDDDTKPKTKVGKTVSRSLAAVENKLKDFETSKETRQIIQRWLANLVKQLKTDPTYEQFLQDCAKCFQNQLETVTTPPSTGTPRSRTRQSISEFDKTE